MNYLKHFLFSLIILWLFGFLYVFRSGSYHAKTSNEYDDAFIVDNSKISLKKLEIELKRLEVKNKKNEQLIQSLQEKANKLNEIPIQNIPINTERSFSKNEDKFPSKQFEEMRRKIFSDIKDISYYINARVDNLEQSKLPSIKNEFNNRINLILAELYNMSTSDQLGYWRQQESNKLTEKVQNRFIELQNPKNCDKQRKIICDLNKACGFGCQVHHVMYCFITSYFTNRTMILQSNNWRYNPKGWEAYFKPVSENCATTTDSISEWNDAGLMEEKAIRMPIIDVINIKPKYFPLSIPKEYENELKKFHGDPFIWWVGQILSYLMRFNTDFIKTVNKKTADLGFQNSCVGVHVRRTDKVGTEAAYHGLDEYMKQVESYFNYKDLVQGTKTQRVVYLATDDVEVIKEARTKYTDYNFIFDENNAKSASVNQRYSPDSAQGVILDIHYLSQCEYLICTFSSQVCRMAYELMQKRFPDASWRFRSLDDVYYFGGQNGHDVVALYDHQPDKSNDEIELKKGDKIGLAGNHWNGLSKGRNQRTNQDGLFPSYKVKNVIQVY